MYVQVACKHVACVPGRDGGECVLAASRGGAVRPVETPEHRGSAGCQGVQHLQQDYSGRSPDQHLLCCSARSRGREWGVL